MLRGVTGFNCVYYQLRWSSTCILHSRILNKHKQSHLSHLKRVEDLPKYVAAPRDYKYLYPDFLPNPEIEKRDQLCERLQRRDMMRRRTVMEIPEFYVGSILAVIAADVNAPGKQNRFVGICIQRSDYGLRAYFTLRNVIDGQGVEVMYDLYNPTLQKIEVIKLEKRLDDELFYLRDSPPEYSIVPFDLEPSPLPPGSLVPVNQIKVKLGPRPWHERWERKCLQGVMDLGLPQKFYDRAKHPQIAKPWTKYDMMKKYRENINDVEVDDITSEVYMEIQNIQHNRQNLQRKKLTGNPVEPAVET